MHLYNTLARYRYGGPVRSLLLMLRPEANAAAATGVHSCSDEHGEYLRFRYRVIRLWELPSEPLLHGPLGLLPLCLLTDDAAPRLGDLLHQLDSRLDHEKLSKADHAEILTACHILLGLRYDRAVIRSLFRELRTMRESSTYMAILEEGEAKGRLEGEILGLREAIKDLGTAQFGPPSREAVANLGGITDANRLRRMLRQLRTAADWNSLLEAA